jgi:hypothetical protein
VPRLDPTKLVATAIGSVLAAVVLSKFGVAGTIMGAALGSVVSTIGTEINEHYLSRSSRRLRELRAAQRRAVQARAGADAGQAQAGADAGQAPAGPDAGQAPASASAGWQRPAWLSWKALAAVGIGGFLIAMLVITAFELAVGEPLAGLVGNQVTSGRSTTFGEVARGDGGRRERSEVPTSTVETDSTSQSTASSTSGTSTTVPATSTTAPVVQQPPATTGQPSATTRRPGG